MSLSFLLSHRTLLGKSLPLVVALVGQSTVCNAQGEAPIPAPSTQIPNVGVVKFGDQGNGIAGRTDREKSASQVMVLQPSASSLVSQAADQELFNESLKRLRTIEASDPALALSQYRQFLVGRQISPVVGVQVAMKVAQLRRSLKDYNGAALTCETFATKFVQVPTSALLLVQKARMLMEQNRLHEAYTCIERAFENAVALGPKHYTELSNTLLQLAYACKSSSQNQDVQDAKSLYQMTEKIYLQWLNSGTESHTWQMFESLQQRYEEIGDIDHASRVLPKVVDSLLRMQATSQNPEGADISVMAARWLEKQGQHDKAMQLYAKIHDYGNSYVEYIGLFDQAKMLLSQGEKVAGKDILRKLIENSSGEVQTASFLLMSHLCYNEGDLLGSKSNAQRVVDITRVSSDEQSKSYLLDATQVLNKVGHWIQTPVVVQPAKLKLSVDMETEKEKNIVRRLIVRTYQDVPIEIKSDNPAIRFSVLDSSSSSGEAVDINRQIVIEIPFDIVEKSLQENITTLHIRILSEGGNVSDVDIVK